MNYRAGREPWVFNKIIVWTSKNAKDVGASPTVTSGSGAPTASEPKGSFYLRTGGTGGSQVAYLATDAVGTWEAVDAASKAISDLTLTTGAMIYGAAGVGAELDLGATAQGLPLSDGIGGLTVGTLNDHPVVDACGVARFLNPIAEEYVSIVADVLCADGAQIIAGQPDYPRELVINVTIATNPITGGIATVVGVGASGEAVNVVVDLTTAVTVKLYTGVALATVTRITVSGLAGGAGAGDNIGVGVSSKLGLPGSLTPPSSNFAVYKTVVNDADEAVAGVDTVNGTVDPTTAPSGAADFQFYYTYRLAALAHTIA